MRKLLLFALLCFWQLGLGAENDPPSQATDQQDSNPESLLEGDELIAAEVTEADEDEADPPFVLFQRSKFRRTWVFHFP